MKKTYYLLRNTLQYREWYLKRGDAIPADVPASVVEAWLKAKHIGEKAPTGK